MVNTCCMPACNSGYRSNKNGKKAPLFQFSVNSELCDKWYRAIPRKNWKVSKPHKVCANTFMKVISKLFQLILVVLDVNVEIP